MEAALTCLLSNAAALLLMCWNGRQMMAWGNVGDEACDMY